MNSMRAEIFFYFHLIYESFSAYLLNKQMNETFLTIPEMCSELIASYSYFVVK